MTMSLQDGRFVAAAPPILADGWTCERLTAPSRLFGANGLRTGPDGRIYIAQVTGSQISALDVDTGRLQTISAKGGDIIAPDDMARSVTPMASTAVVDMETGERVAHFSELDATIPYVLTFRMRPTPARLRLLQSTAFAHAYVLIEHG
jgi:hypothetical protein